MARPQQLRLAVEAAARLEILDGRELATLLGRSRGRRGVKPLKAAVAYLRGPAPWTQSELERQFLALISEAGIPEPQVNVMVAGELVDFFWPLERLVVEVDGYEWHKGRTQFERDRAKDTKLQLTGCVVLRPTQRRIAFEARKLVADVRAALTAARRAEASDP